MKVTLEFDSELDSKTEINAAIKAGDLALCIYELEKLARKKYDTCDEGSELDIMISEIYEIINNRIGSVWDYTE